MVKEEMAAKQAKLLCRLKPKVNYRIIEAVFLTTENRFQQIQNLAPET